MSFTWISLAVVAIVGVTKLFTYLLGDKRKVRQLKVRQYALEEELRQALAKNDTVGVSSISIELNRVRTQIDYFNKK